MKYAINRRISAINADIRTTIFVINNVLATMIEKLEQVKIPHANANINNNEYAIKHGSFAWTTQNNKLENGATVKGVYKLTLVPLAQFNISSSGSTGDNNIISRIIDKGTAEQFRITFIDNKLARVSVTWHVDFVADLRK